MPYAFISYVKEDNADVQKLAKALKRAGIGVWLDKTALKPGERWKDSIRRAITEGEFFIACFSQSYADRVKTYMNEELMLAIEELRQRPANRTWFIPVLLSRCEIPDRSIGAGETLRSIQWVSLYDDWRDGIRKILSVLVPEPSNSAAGSARRDALAAIEIPIEVTSLDVKAVPVEQWAARRAPTLWQRERDLMARYFVENEFLSRELAGPDAPLEPAASIFVAPGTTPLAVVKAALAWLREKSRETHYDITWHSVNTIVLGCLSEFTRMETRLQAAARSFLFPGTIDEELQAVLGADTVKFARALQRRFTCSLLTSHGFDLEDGAVYFHFSREIEMQSACAQMPAQRKYLFLGPWKFRAEGEIGYRINDLISTAFIVTIYTTASERDDFVKSRFHALCERVLRAPDSPAELANKRILRLVIINPDGRDPYIAQREGFAI